MFAQLVDLKIKTRKDEEASYLLHAHLAALLDGVSHGHIDDESFDAVRTRFTEVLVARDFLDAAGVRTAKPLRAEQVWNCFTFAVDVVSREVNARSGEPHALSDTRDAQADYGSSELASLSQLEYHDEATCSGANLLDLDDYRDMNRPKIARFGLDRSRLADIVTCINAAISHDGAIARKYLKGDVRYVTWMTPRTGMVSALLDQVDADGVITTALDQLRDLLGLWMENGKGRRPLGAFCFTCTGGMRAPNVITASGYPRFRHRPAGAMASDPNAGLTFNLDKSAAATAPGSCELVATGIQMAQMTEVRMCGQPTGFGLDRKAELAEHRRYAEEASGGRPWWEVVAELELAA